MRHDTAREITIGDKVNLHVAEFNGKPVLETEFIQYDLEIRARYLKERGIDEDDYFEQCDEVDDAYCDGQISFRSVRIYHVAEGEHIKMKFGHEVRGVVSDVRLAKEETKDGRKKLHITLSRAMRVYRWSRRVVSAPHCLVFTCWSGNLMVNRREIRLSHKNGILVENGRAYRATATVLPNGSVLSVRLRVIGASITTGDYRLAQRQKGRAMRDIDKDFLQAPSCDRLIPTRERRRRARHERVRV